jgi:lipopolysaccharide export LptBFGC system permease protein LptF
VSAVVWFPSARDALNVTDLALAWAAGLSELATTILLSHALAQVAGQAGDHAARTWLQTARTLMIVVAVLPAIVLGGGLHSLDSALALTGSLVLLLLVVLLFRYSGRPWALPARGAVPAGRRSD